MRRKVLILSHKGCLFVQSSVDEWRGKTDRPLSNLSFQKSVKKKQQNKGKKSRWLKIKQEHFSSTFRANMDSKDQVREVLDERNTVTGTLKAKIISEIFGKISRNKVLKTRKS